MTLPPVLDAADLRGHNGGPPDKPDNRPVYAERQCPECMGGFKPRQAGTLFCCPAHKRTWNNRWTVRGSQLAQYAAVARITRDGSRGSAEDRATGKRAAAIMRRLIQRFRDEDRAAGRMWLPAFMRDRLKVTDEPL